jgi:tetratricopeptide (TPR) repeat protein
MDTHLEELLRSILECNPQGRLNDGNRETMMYALVSPEYVPVAKYEAIRKFANSITNEVKRSSLINRLSARTAEQHQFTLSERIANSISLPFWKYDALVKIAAEMLKADRQFRTSSLYRKEFQEGAFRLLHQVEEDLSLVPEDDLPSIIYSAGLTLVDAGELDWAQKFSASTQYCAENTEVLMRVAQARAAQGDTNQALQIARLVAHLASTGNEAMTNRAFDLESVAELVAEFGDKTEALRYFEEAVRCATEGQGNDIDGAKCLAGLAVKLAKHGHIDSAREVANEVTQAARRKGALDKIEEISLGMNQS